MPLVPSDIGVADRRFRARSRRRGAGLFAVIKIYEIGIKPSLTEAEKKAIGDFEFRFPYPKGNDELMNFYATPTGAR
jgi:hypothetical protein